MEIFKQELRTEESPTVQNILEGKAEIAFSSEQTESKKVNGREWRGRSFVYELTVPHPTKQEENWTTELIVWSPDSSYKLENRFDIPETQIFINTGKGEMLISDNQEVVNKIFEEINRQVSKENKP